MSTEDTTITEDAAPPIDLKDPKLYINRELGIIGISTPCARGSPG